MSNQLTPSQQISTLVSRQMHIAGRRLDFDHLAAAGQRSNIGEAAYGKTAIEFIADVERQMDDRFLSTRTLKCKLSGEVSNVNVPRFVALNCKALRKSELSFVMTGPAYRASPKNTLPRVFQNLQRAALAKRVSRLVQRLAP